MDIDPFVNAYLKAALWSSNDDDGEPLDTYFSASDIDLETLGLMVADCGKFQSENADDLARLYVATQTGPEQGGHDFWLTRNGHGAGFWDRGAGEVGDKLTEAAKAFGGFDLYTDGEYVRN